MTDDDFGKRYLRETVIDSIHVTDGMLTLGIKGNDGWYKADNFRLYYLGDGTTSVTPVHKGTATVKAYGGEGCISLQGPEGQVLTVSIYGTDGRMVRQVTVNGREQVRGLSKGLYIVDRQKSSSGNTDNRPHHLHYPTSTYNVWKWGFLFHIFITHNQTVHKSKIGDKLSYFTS